MRVTIPLFQHLIKTFKLVRCQDFPELQLGPVKFSAQFRGNRFHQCFRPFLALAKHPFHALPLLGRKIQLPLCASQELKAVTSRAS